MKKKEVKREEEKKKGDEEEEKEKKLDEVEWRGGRRKEKTKSPYIHKKQTVYWILVEKSSSHKWDTISQ